jgi:hypothetical protein
MNTPVIIDQITDLISEDGHILAKSIAEQLGIYDHRNHSPKNRRQQWQDHRQQQPKINSRNNTTTTTATIILSQNRSKLPRC